MNSLTPDLLAFLATSLYGPLWQEELARHLQHPEKHDKDGWPVPGIDSSSIRRWLSSNPRTRRRIPAWVGPELHRLVLERLQELETAALQLETCLPVNLSSRPSYSLDESVQAVQVVQTGSSGLGPNKVRVDLDNMTVL